MRFLLAFFCPPLAILLCGKPFSALVNLVLYVIGIFTLLAGIGAVLLFISVVHGVKVVSDYKSNKRLEKLAAIRR